MIVLVYIKVIDMIKKLCIVLIGCLSFVYSAEAMEGHEALASSSEQSPRRKPLSRQQSIDDVDQVREAVVADNFELLQTLLKDGKKAFTDATVHGKKSIPPLRQAVLNKKKEMVELLLEYDSNIDWQDEAGNTYLHVLICFGDDQDSIEIFKMFLNKDANLTIENQARITPIALIRQMGAKATDLRNALIEKKPDYAPMFPTTPKKQLQLVPPLNLPKNQLSPRLKEIEKAKKHILTEQEEESTGLLGSLGYFGLGMAGTIAAFRLYTMLFKSKEQQKKPVQ